MPQLSYSETMAEGFAGMKADSGFDRVESFAAEELTADEGLPFGRFLVAGTDPAKQVKLPETDAETVRGISIHQHTENGKYNDGETVSTLRKGVVLMEATAAIPIDTVLYAIVAAGADNGKPTATAGTNLLTTAVARSAAAAAGDIIKVEIDLP